MVGQAVRHACERRETGCRRVESNPRRLGHILLNIIVGNSNAVATNIYTNVDHIGATVVTTTGVSDE